MSKRDHDSIPPDVDEIKPAIDDAIDRFYTYFRRHLSALLAGTLCVLMIVREIGGALLPHWLTVAFVICGVLGTLVAWWWELKGDKPTTSPRDIWFAIAMREGIRQLDWLDGSSASTQPKLAFDEFLKLILHHACKALCGEEEVQGGFLVKHESKECLKVERLSSNARYPPNLEIPLGVNGQEPGAAGVAYALDFRGVVHVPDKETRKAIVHKWSQTSKHGYWKCSEPVTAWTVYPNLQEFKSSLNVPVYNATLGASKKAGVLTFSSPKKFLRDDFIIAECAAHLITQALSVTARMIEPTATGAPNEGKLKELEAVNQSLKILVADLYLENKSRRA